MGHSTDILDADEKNKQNRGKASSRNSIAEFGSRFSSPLNARPRLSWARRPEIVRSSTAALSASSSVELFEGLNLVGEIGCALLDDADDEERRCSAWWLLTVAGFPSFILWI